MYRFNVPLGWFRVYWYMIGFVIGDVPDLNIIFLGFCTELVSIWLVHVGCHLGVLRLLVGFSIPMASLMTLPFLCCMLRQS